jgi:Spy/CpxP family protein refolding chaperone
MKTPSLLLTAALALSIAAPLAAFAQQAPPADAPSPGAHMHHHGYGFMHGMHGVNLSDQQKTQIHQLVQQYRQSHPEGSQPDPAARKQLRTQIMNVLTPAQQAQVKANMEKMRAEHEHGEQSESPAPAPQTTP